MSSPPHTDEPDRTKAGSGGSPDSRSKAPHSIFRLVALAAALAAGFTAWAIGETSWIVVKAGETDYKLMGVDIRGETAETAAIADRQTLIRTFALFGGLLSLSLGIAGGFRSGSGNRAIAPTVVATATAALFGAASAMVAFPLKARLREAGLDELTVGPIVHSVLLVPLAAAAGAALGAGRNQLIAGVVGGAIGGLVAAVLFQAAGASFFPLANTDQPISTTADSRLAARVLSAAVIAALALISIGREAKMKPTEG